MLASTSLDRFFRLHSTYETQNKGNGKKGDVLAKIWVKSAASCVAWDQKLPVEQGDVLEEHEDVHDIWAGMQNVGGEHDITSGSDSEDDGRRTINNKRKKIQ